MARTNPEVSQVWTEFHRAVNMSSPELRDWLLARAAWNDEYPPEPGIDLPALGERVLRLLEKRQTDVTAEDVELMREVADIVNTRLANRPPNGVQDDPWRHSLMTLGHDPLHD
jgi:hypothetical protein